MPFGQPAFGLNSDVTARISNDVMAHLLVIIPSERWDVRRGYRAGSVRRNSVGALHLITSLHLNELLGAGSEAAFRRTIDTTVSYLKITEGFPSARNDVVCIHRWNHSSVSGHSKMKSALVLSTT